MNYNKLSTNKLIKEFEKAQKRLRKNKIIVEYKSLGYDSKKRKICGYAYINDNRVEIEKKAKAKETLKFLCHELTHLAFPLAKELEVLKAESIIANTLWNEGYRKVILK